MNYLALARTAADQYERNEKTLTRRSDDSATGYERNELHEKTPILAPHEAERLKVRIIEVVTADPALFDRTEYERLTARWEAHASAGGAS